MSKSVQIMFNSCLLLIEKTLHVRSECVYYSGNFGMFVEDVVMKKLKVGDKVKIPVHDVFHPEAGHVGKVVYISGAAKSVTVKCDRKHNGKTVAFNVALESIDE
ncbi:MAG TPA: hypothetical protein ENN36_08615 [Candidatus Bathyarchaeota archaeon]|nr:hypothetical protein [Candidatus Bathyarchaeota archaeon]